MRPKRKFSKKEIKALAKQPISSGGQFSRAGLDLGRPDFKTAKTGAGASQEIALPKIIPVRDLAQKMAITSEKLITELIKNGVMANINDSIDLETAQIIGDDLGFKITGQQSEKKLAETVASRRAKPRPPVVVIMGHVDSGKTSLLDAIRKTDVVSGESGQITQHIGAYQVQIPFKKNRRPITFLDTPGHEAFSSMRAHGANITDIAVIVIAADDGIKPQTIEAINHAKNAGMPLIIAINKIDLPEADAEKVKRQLAEINLLPEEWGGKIPTVEISAKQDKNLDELLEMILLVADMAELKADPAKLARGVVIESKIIQGFGPVATVLVQEGTLERGEIIGFKNTWAKIKALIDCHGQKISQARPAMPVQVAGIKALPEVGEIFQELKDEKQARALGRCQSPIRVKSISSQDQSGSDIDLIPKAKLIIKADVDGSLKALQAKIQEVDANKIRIDLVSSGVGKISETDINLASATHALVLGFKVDQETGVKKLAMAKKVKVMIFEVIYELWEALLDYLEEQLPPIIKENPLGQAAVIKIFHQFKTQVVAGAKIKNGTFLNNLDANQIRGDQKVGKLKVTNLEIDKQAVKEAKAGQTCGLKISKKAPFAKLKPGDIIEVYEHKKQIQKLR